MKKYESRKITPWEDGADLTATQIFLKNHYDSHYTDRHRKLDESGEADMINSYIPVKCPYCGKEKFKKSGHTKNGIQRYMCSDCRKTFLSTTGTIFDEHRISISEWMEFCLNIFRHVSITAESWSNKNTFQTSRYWLQKLFLTLENVQENIILTDRIWLDETFYTVRSEDIIRNADGTKLRGLSRNQFCIGVATDKQNSLFLVEGMGKVSQKKTLETFKNHIVKESTLIHDRDDAHRRLVKELSLNSVSYLSKETKILTDKDNPLYPVNHVHFLMKHFLNSHSGFNRKYIQDYLNLFAFVLNPPTNLLEKVELIVKMGFQNPKILRYRDFYAVNVGVDE